MADTKKMTNREFYKGVIEMVEGFAEPTASDIELKTFAEKAIEKLDEVNEKRKNSPKKPSKASIENAPIADAIVEYLTNLNGATAIAKDICVGVGQSVQKTSSILRTLADEGRVEKFVPENRNKPIEYSVKVSAE